MPRAETGLGGTPCWLQVIGVPGMLCLGVGCWSRSWILPSVSFLISAQTTEIEACEARISQCGPPSASATNPSCYEARGKIPPTWLWEPSCKCRDLHSMSALFPTAWLKGGLVRIFPIGVLNGDCPYAAEGRSRRGARRQSSR